MHDIVHKTMSTNFLEMFTPLSEIHPYETRQKSKQIFFIKSTRTDYKKRFINYSGIKIWEEIPNSIKSKKRQLFKRNYVSYLMNKYVKSWVSKSIYYTA